MIPLDAEWQEMEDLSDAPPSTVVARAQELFAARVCVECVPESVLERLGLMKPRAAFEAPTGASTTPASLKEVALYADGSCSVNPGPGGWATILVYEGTEREFCGSEKEATSRRMELRAVIEGLRRLKQPCRVSVECDSEYVVKAFSDNWIEGWQRRGWRKANGDQVLNQDLWQELLTEVGKHEVRWTWVQGHAGNAYNERCHELAVQACKAATPSGPGRRGEPGRPTPRPRRGGGPQEFNHARDAAMRMSSEAARHEVCSSCGQASGRHARGCKRNV